MMTIGIRGLSSCSYGVVLALLCQIFIIDIGSQADIIGPSRPTAAEQGQNMPAALTNDLDPAIAAKLQPSVAAFLASRDSEEFKQAYSMLASETDSLPNFEVFLGKLMAAYNQFGEALGVLEKYTNENSEDPEAFVALGSIAATNGRVVDAWLHLLYAQRLVDRDKLPVGRKPYVVPILTELRASVAERRRQWAEAEELFLKLQELKPDTAYPLWRAGRVKVMAGDLQAGFETLQLAYAKDSNLPHPSLVVAQTLHDTTDWMANAKNAARVENWFKKAISDTKDEPSVWASYFKWLILANRPEEVAHRYGQFADSLKSEREIGLIRCVAARYLGDHALAEEILSGLHQANMEDAEVADQLALVLVESADEAKRARALQLAESNLRKAPQLEPIIATAAWVMLKLGETDNARQLFSQLANRGNLSPQSVYYMAEFMEKSGQLAESQRLLKMAVDAPGLLVQRSQAKKRLEEN